ncbi:auxin-responsive protein SAUR50-like [Pyrus communis]|uniref:auxin-responsive protein SAUR50-like n=1 Tax=Pyrus communis TaxID=23211 RepID=UPI0035BEF3D7
MDIIKRKWKKNMIANAWKRRSLQRESSSKVLNSLTKSKSCHCSSTTRKSKGQVAPDGCFSVYVGPQRQRFVVKTEFANHPLFKMLLDDAEMEYGYNCDGPILLPCDVDLFYNVLAEMESSEEISTPNCGFVKGYGSLMLCSPSRRLNSSINDGYGGAYRLLSPLKMLKINQF